MACSFHGSRTRIVVPVLIAILVAACTAAPPATPSTSLQPSPVGTAEATSPSGAATAVPVPTPAPTVEPSASLQLQEFEASTLPAVALPLDTLTIVCDADQDALDPYIGPSLIECVDGATIAFRALRLATGGDATRLYLRRLPCEASPCGEPLASVTVSGWVDGSTWQVGIRVGTRSDGPVTLVTPATRLLDGNWPAFAAATPAIHRPKLDGTSAEVAGRDPLPFCGEIDIAAGVDPPGVRVCLLAAVLEGRPAELIERPITFEGQDVVVLYRFVGHGGIALYELADGHWFRTMGALGLPPVGTDVWSVHRLPGEWTQVP